MANLSSGAQVLTEVAIVATGGFQVPLVPAMAANLSKEVRQLTGESYRTPADVSGTRVLVVGDGATGRDIAAELASSHSVALSCGRPRRLLPEKFLGVGVWTWLKVLGLLQADANSPVGRRLRAADPFLDRQRDLMALGRAGVAIKPRAIATVGREVRFAEGGGLEVDTVIWALGYRDDTTWLDIEGAVDADGAFRHYRGRSPVPGLYFVGRPWLRNRASALIMGAGADARLIAAEVSEAFGHDARTAVERTLKLR